MDLKDIFFFFMFGISTNRGLNSRLEIREDRVNKKSWSLENLIKPIDKGHLDKDLMYTVTSPAAFSLG